MVLLLRLGFSTWPSHHRVSGSGNKGGRKSHLGFIVAAYFCLWRGIIHMWKQIAVMFVCNQFFLCADLQWTCIISEALLVLRAEALLYCFLFCLHAHEQILCQRRTQDWHSSKRYSSLRRASVCFNIEANFIFAHFECVNHPHHAITHITPSHTLLIFLIFFFFFGFVHLCLQILKTHAPLKLTKPPHFQRRRIWKRCGLY